MLLFSSKLKFIEQSIRSKIFFKTYSQKLNNILLKMSRNKEHIMTAQSQRIKLKAKSQNYIPGCISLQVLGTGAEGAPKALYVFTDNSRYLFNCGEGTQRLAHEHKKKLARLEHIFITQAVWQNIGGLPGLTLTIQEVGVPSIHLHSPVKIDELFAATHRFVVLKDLKILSDDYSTENFFEDHVLNIKYVLHQQDNVKLNDESMEQNNATSNSGYISDDDTDYYDHETNRRAQKFNKIPNELREPKLAMSYICQIHPRPGTLSLEKCVEKGVRPGPLFGKLKNGEDITLEDGTVVKSIDVCLPEDPGLIFLVVDCPNLEFLESFVNNKKWLPYQCKTVQKGNDNPCVIFHFSSPEVISDIRYQKWMDQFSPSTNHIILNSSNKGLGSEAVHRVHDQLNFLDDELFPPLYDIYDRENINEPPLKKICIESDNLKQHQIEIFKLLQAKILWSFHLRPKSFLDTSHELKLSRENHLSELNEETKQAIETIRPTIEKIRKTNSNKSIYPKLLFLGTGSCIPNKTRNTSGILVEISENSFMILDCGEGTYGQLIRYFGKSNFINVLKNLKAIYVSHLHADHHIGLIGLLTNRRKLFQEFQIKMDPLILFAPQQINWWLNMYNKRFEPISNEFKLCSNHTLDSKKFSINLEFYNEILSKLNLSELKTTLVRHCANAFGVALITSNGEKITYSGDTMPSDNLVELGENSDILIHEATMEDELIHEALFKLHSTTSQAIEIGNRMNAKNIILTHFSQRYARLPRISDDVLKDNGNISVAFDFLKINFNDLPILPLLYPVLKLIFHEHLEDLEIKAAKRQAKIERKRNNILNEQKVANNKV